MSGDSPPPLLWQVELEVTAEQPGTTLRAPTSEGGLVPACRDTCSGVLRLQMWERRSDGSNGKVCCHIFFSNDFLILKTHLSNLASSLVPFYHLLPFLRGY